MMAEASTRGMDPPAENWTQDSDDEQPPQDTSALLVEPKNENTAMEASAPVDTKQDETALKPLTDVATNIQTTGEPSSSDAFNPTTTNLEGASTKPKRTSYSKDKLNPTQQGKMIQTGVDPSPPSDGKLHQPAYISKLLKATGYGDKIKQGAEVPRDHIAHPVDPNDSLADVYKSQSTKFKSTGFAEKLKQGADVPRDHIVQVEDPNDKLADVYKNVNFKATGFGDKLKQGEDVRAPSEKTDQTGSLYASINLKKAGNPEEKKAKNTTNKESSLPVKLKKAETIVKDPSTLRAKMPEVKLHKTEIIVKDAKAATTFKLPEEFSMAKQNLKRRTESHWYSSEIPQAKPSKKWFFQRGEWNDGDTTPNNSPASATSTANKSSWFFGTSSSSTTISVPVSLNKTPAPAIFRGSKTMLKTNKATVQHFHIPSEGKSAVKPTYNKNYYDEIQRRRGLEPKKSRVVRTWIWRLFKLFVVLSMMGAAAFYYGTHHHPEQMEQAWQNVAPHVEPIVEWAQPHVRLVKERLQPHVQLVKERMQPHIDLMVERAHPQMESLIEIAHPYAVATVDRVCASVEGFAVPEEHKKWLGRAHGMAISSCIWTRTQLRTSEGSILLEPGGEATSKPGHSTSQSKKRAVPKEAPPATRDSDVLKKDEQTCNCDSPEPKGLKKLLQKLPGQKKNRDGCDCGPVSA